MPYDSLSTRGTELSISGGLRDGFGSVLQNPYNASSNPSGFVNIGTSESYIMLNEIAAFANRNLRFDARDYSYGEGPWGSSRLRNAMAKHITKHFKAVSPVSRDDILFSNGVTGLSEQLGFSICDPGDGIMFTQPIYQAFPIDFGTRAKVTPVFVPSNGLDTFAPEALEQYEAVYDRASREGVKIRAVMLCNPHNPLGQCYQKSTIIALMQFCQQRKLHLLADEIYALSVYDVAGSPETVPFTSVLSFDTTPYISDQYLHVLYGMSKDFASGGLRLGCCYTRNKELRRAMGAMSQFHWLSNPSEKLAALMLEDEAWLEEFLSLSRQRLAQRNALTRQLLDVMRIGYSNKTNAGFFVWADLRTLLPRHGRDGQAVEGWDAEAELVEMLRSEGVYMTPGRDLTAEEPGWFRVIFSQEESVLREGMKRVGNVIRRIEQEKAHVSQP